MPAPAAAILLREVSRLVALFRAPNAGAEARRSALRAAVRAARAATLDLEVDEHTLRLNGVAHFLIGSDEEELVTALRAGRVARLSVRRHAGARDVAHLAGLLAGPAVGVDGARRVTGEALAQEMDALRLWSVRLVPAVAAAAPAALPAPLADAVERVRAAADESERGVACAALVAATDEALGEGVPDESRDDAVRAVATALAAIPQASADDLEVGLGVQDEAAAASLLTPQVLAAAAAALVRAAAGELRAAALAVARRAGDGGARALLAELTTADTIAARRRCFDALLDVGCGIADLVTALEHPQWYVVRNVAELLGELEAREAEPGLSALLRHADPRVRDAVAVALERLGTPAALAALRGALDDASPTVRRLAVRAIGAAGAGAGAGRSAAARLIAAFDREADTEVRLEAVSALGRLGTFDAMQRLLRLAGAREAHQGAAVRVAALHAIAQARGEAAYATLRSLVDDREPAVREAARRLLTILAA